MVSKPEAGAKTTPQGQQTGSKLRWLALAALALFGTLLLSWGLSPTDPAASTVSAISTTAASPQPKYETREIRDIRTGHRVMADNPGLADDDVPLEEITPETHRNLVFRQPKPDGSLVEFELVRSLDWIAWTGAEAGRTVELNLNEFGVEGPAEVLDIQPCPTLEEGPGRLVTGTFRHTAHNVIEVYIAGLDEPIGVTANHPFWSEDRQVFVAAGGLRAGESVLQADGEAGHVIRVTSTPHTATVFNIEVDGEHVYYVSGSGILVHNTCAGLHHLIPRALGSEVRYGDSALTAFNQFRHTKIHLRLSKHLNEIDKTVDGVRYTMLPKRGQSGQVVRKVFSPSERLKALDDFYRTYNNGEYYQDFLAELQYTIGKGLFK